jgi:hypothetical protein
MQKFVHEYRLPSPALERSLVSLGQQDATARLIQRLRANLPVTLGVVGASVAQNGGCHTQPKQRCMAYSGQRGQSSGFAVRLLNLINASFPHPKHRISNAARDSTPAQNVVECLFTTLSTEVRPQPCACVPARARSVGRMLF